MPTYVWKPRELLVLWITLRLLRIRFMKPSTLMQSSFLMYVSADTWSPPEMRQEPSLWFDVSAGTRPTQQTIGIDKAK